jgi:ATP-dependent DNA helicase RecG
MVSPAGIDDRINQQATVDDFDLWLIQAYLQEIKSNLYKESIGMPLEDVCRTMLIAKGSKEYLRPINVGLMFFCKEPERFFPRCWIELVWHKDNSYSRNNENTKTSPRQGIPKPSHR